MSSVAFVYRSNYACTVAPLQCRAVSAAVWLASRSSLSLCEFFYVALHTTRNTAACGVASQVNSVNAARTYYELLSLRKFYCTTCAQSSPLLSLIHMHVSFVFLLLCILSVLCISWRQIKLAADCHRRFQRKHVYHITSYICLLWYDSTK